MNKKTLTRIELVENISTNVGLPVSASTIIVEKIFDLILSELEGKRDVKISSFGSFLIRHKKMRMGRNPKTGIEAKINSRNVVTFSPSNILKSKFD